MFGEDPGSTNVKAAAYYAGLEPLDDRPEIDLPPREADPEDLAELHREQQLRERIRFPHGILRDARGHVWAKAGPG